MRVLMKARIGDEELRIYPDHDSESPREWDNLGKMVCFHRRYPLGDEHDIKKENFNSWDKLEDYLHYIKDAHVILPLYLYDHSGITMSTDLRYPYNDRWDAGQVGFIYATKEDIRKSFMRKRITSLLRGRVMKVLRGEIKTYDQYLRGDIFGFEIVKLVKCNDCNNVEEKSVNSCWGFYGNVKDSGMYSHIDEKWKSVELEECN